MEGTDLERIGTDSSPNLEISTSSISASAVKTESSFINFTGDGTLNTNFRSMLLLLQVPCGVPKCALNLRKMNFKSKRIKNKLVLPAT